MAGCRPCRASWITSDGLNCRSLRRRVLDQAEHVTLWVLHDDDSALVVDVALTRLAPSELAYALDCLAQVVCQQIQVNTTLAVPGLRNRLKVHDRTAIREWAQPPPAG